MKLNKQTVTSILGITLMSVALAACSTDMTGEKMESEVMDTHMSGEKMMEKKPMKGEMMHEKTMKEPMKGEMMKKEM
ncbi:MAG: hypothetical protein RPU61_08335 [Candidatus Sedimenticola sp. (ex Thyasira tokunagai)]